ncbi:HvfC/BufC N-terminal domain-containing protein [Roseivirga thermotolerans]|uniref:Putative DNA-binding domain-containing protein n=1 Tax=Roseivirga thermotolerans TaxID=1758176 RepID=A0ABQ3I5F2_9BACT|nr:DNA-binding domain-containing protein [Roseivirga thermotolerans]GHE59952.1 hypothetical protein GCM10011340_13350 [Roseivirga thermotolerans]
MTKPSLSATQKWMQQILVSPLAFETDPNSYLPDSFKNDVEKLIKPNSRLSANERLQIYQTGYLARLRDCMEKQFSVLQMALGKELFQAFVDDYLQKYPSQSYTLSELGHRFAQYLEETRPDKELAPEERETWPDFMIELVRFEYKITRIFDADFSTTFEYALLKTPSEQLRLVEALELFAFKFPISQYYQQAIKGKSPAIPTPLPTYVALARTKDFRIGLFELNRGQYIFLNLWKMHGQFAPTLKAFIEQTGIDQKAFQEVWPKWKEYFTESLLLST